MRNSESGNVIFYILIAVALLAALSYVVSSTMRGNGKGISNEKSSMFAAEIIEYGNIVNTAVNQIRLRGVPPEALSFENQTVSGYENPLCTEDGCKIFNIGAGGGINYMQSKPEWLDAAQKDQLRYGEIFFTASSSVDGIGTQDKDLVLVIPYLQRDLCVAINKKLMIGLPENAAIPQEAEGPVDIESKFNGNFDEVGGYRITGGAEFDAEGPFQGKMAGCTASSGDGKTPVFGTFHYYQVLQAR